MAPHFAQAAGHALVIGLFGGAALVLTMPYSRRGPLIYPVYAAILFTLGLSLSRATALGFGARLAITSAAIGLSTAISFVAVLRRSALLRASGKPLARGHIPALAFPLLILTLFAASAGVAYVSS